MVGLLHNTIYHEMHALILVFNLIDTSLSLFYRFTTISLKMGKRDLLSEMRPKCGPFQQFGPHADQVRNCGLLRKHWVILLKDGENVHTLSIIKHSRTKPASYFHLETILDSISLVLLSWSSSAIIHKRDMC